jgi:hypothetical protein
MGWLVDFSVREAMKKIPCLDKTLRISIQNRVFIACVEESFSSSKTQITQEGAT